MCVCVCVCVCEGSRKNIIQIGEYIMIWIVFSATFILSDFNPYLLSYIYIYIISKKEFTWDMKIGNESKAFVKHNLEKKITTLRRPKC